MTTINDLLAEHIRSARGERTISQDELARRVGVNRATIANIENSRQRVSVETLLKLCVAFDEEPSVFITDEMIEAARSGIPPMLDESLPEEDRRRVESALNDLLT